MCKPPGHDFPRIVHEPAARLVTHRVGARSWARASIHSMSDWKFGAASPFLSERARVRAPQIVDYAAAGGGAVLVSPTGDVILSRGTIDDLERRLVVRTARQLGAGDGLVSFQVGRFCVHAAPVRDGWLLCTFSCTSISPTVLVDRLKRASQVMALALVDDGRSGDHEGSRAGSSGTGSTSARIYVFPKIRQN